MRVREIVRGDPAEIAHHLWACVHGHVMLDLLMQVGADDEAASRTFDRAIGLMLDGVAPHTTARPRARER
jgi:hypothetical protein